MTKKTIGVLGGMGPDATAYLFSSIIRQTKAQHDQDHVHILVNNNPKIPDRSAYILGKGDDPVPELLRSALKLKEAGADFIVIPCNTAHYFLDRFIDKLGIPVISMIETTAGYIGEQYPQVQAAGLLSTLGTYQTRIYEKAFAKKNIRVVVPAKKDQDEIMEAIYGEVGIKAGYRDGPARVMVSQSEALVRKGAELVISGCTEIALVLTQDLIPIRVINPLDILACEAIKEAGYEVRKAC